MSLDDRMRAARNRIDSEVASIDVPANNTAHRSRRRTVGRASASVVLLAVVVLAALALRPTGGGPVKVPVAGTPKDVGPYVLNQSNLDDPHNRDSHWHAALGVFDCDHWMSDGSGDGVWNWPATTPQNSPARADNHDVYAGLHSHDDGIIHMEPAFPTDAGMNATLGRYFDYGGWKLSSTGFSFLGRTVSNGEPCKGSPATLHWWVNSSEQHGDPAAYKLYNNDIIVIAFNNGTFPGLPPSFKNMPDAQTRNGVLVPGAHGERVVKALPIIVAAPGGELRFSPDQIDATTGLYDVRVHGGTAGHTFTFVDPDVRSGVAGIDKAGETVTLEAFFGKPGDYVFECVIPGHAAAGMRGVVHVTGKPMTLDQALAAQPRTLPGG